MKNLINSKMPFSKEYKVIERIFVLTGGKFFLLWLLPTNPGTKNPLFRFLWRGSYGYAAFDRKERLLDCRIHTLIHIFGIIIMTVIYANAKNYTVHGIVWFTLFQMIANIYPILCNLYIGFRCNRINTIKNMGMA